MGPMHIADRPRQRVVEFTMKTRASSSLAFLFCTTIPYLLYQYFLHNAGLWSADAVIIHVGSVW